MYTRFFLQLNQFPKLIMLAALLISFFFFGSNPALGSSAFFSSSSAMLLFTARNAPSGYTSIGDLARHHPSANRKSWTQKRIQIQEN